METVARRRSKLAPPPGGVFAALVRHLPAWWVSVDGEQEPRVLESSCPSDVTLSSPFLWRPGDIAILRLEFDQWGAGCVLEIHQLSDHPCHPREAATMRHRWGEHLDRDLRNFIDDGSIEPYRFSAYRGDVDDWAIIDSLEHRTWVATQPVWAQVQLGPMPSLALGARAINECLLAPGTVVWSFALGRHQTSARCLAQEPDQIDALVVPGRARMWSYMTTGDAYARENFELVIPIAVFGRQLKQHDRGDPPASL